jgi:hypothetical protein
MKLADPYEEIQERFGIGRTKSFVALSAAMGADAADVERTLDELNMPGGNESDRLYAFLADRPHLIFGGSAKRKWANDLSFLRAMIESDPNAKAVVEQQIWKKSWWESVTSVFGYELDKQHMYRRLAGNGDLIHKALTEKDWIKAPDQAAQLLGLNPLEARSLAAAEMNQASLTATKLLWDKYHPQYKVWIPFAIIGVIATIALGIFGQMAKRWKDMNA